MSQTGNIGSKIKATASGRDADKILYFYKRIEHEPKSNTIHILGLQGATSGTNTKTAQSTATKTATIKGIGAANQQRTVDTIFQNPKENEKDLYWDLYAAWEKGEKMGLWRVDFNTVHGTKPNRKVQAQFSQAYLPNLPNTEALAGTATSNLQFEVDGLERALNTDENAFELDEVDFDDGVFDSVNKLYNFSHGIDLGVDENGNVVDETLDDDSIMVQNTTTGEDVYGPAYKSVDIGNESTPINPTDVTARPTIDGADVATK
ncbi:hypothetical protein M5C72_02765 [Companilactobacillus allii]|uniref:Phage tail protein n=1 Tax=Companilactobacillus allii TaxID=1847728 RepID=A0A1P8Q2H1_9LACO|nr:hypothetical protein [Companilactobacillus allii]APX72084.1 hypothetical protein BTM29_05680 [Companilactobacillus allii]USQ69177.1 hypothetical protein M5C72_02765 [Companilactobacillus allii]